MKMMTARLRRGLGFTMFFGRGERIRTSDSYVPNVVLYQAELRPDSRCDCQCDQNNSSKNHVIFWVIGYRCQHERRQERGQVLIHCSTK